MEDVIAQVQDVVCMQVLCMLSRAPVLWQCLRESFVAEREETCSNSIGDRTAHGRREVCVRRWTCSISRRPAQTPELKTEVAESERLLGVHQGHVAREHAWWCRRHRRVSDLAASSMALADHSPQCRWFQEKVALPRLPLEETLDRRCGFNGTGYRERMRGSIYLATRTTSTSWSATGQEMAHSSTGFVCLAAS